MKRNILQWTGIAALSALSLTACKPDRVTEEPILAVLLSTAVRGAAQGNCAISVNATGISYGTLVQFAVNHAANAAYNSAPFLAHYNALNGTSLTAGQLAAVDYNSKYDAFFTDRGDWNDAARATLIRAVETAVKNNLLAGAGLGSVAYGNLETARGTGLLACAKIPRANCSLGGLTTATRVADIDSKNAIRKLLVENESCVKTNAIMISFSTSLLRGAPTDLQTANGVVTASTNRQTNSFSRNAAENVLENQVIAERAYPKFGNLVTLGFGQLMPMRTGTTEYSLTTDRYTNGSNLNVTVVDSCESIGISTGLTAKPLSPVSEIVYAFSNQNAAATLYASANAANGGNDRETGTCNASFRAALNKALPLALKDAGIVIDPNVFAPSGNGSATDTLGLCIYGGTAAKRTVLGAVLNSSLGTTPPNCNSETAINAVGKFGEEGLRSFTANGTAIDGN